jgi:23S rRNA (uracil1939-C5)-methyltransferase
VTLAAGQVVELAIDRLAYGGDGVARHDGVVVFVPFTAPGERVRARVTEVRKRFARAALEDVLVPSPERRAPPCRYFGACGGCQLQHLTEAAQREAKVGFVRDALRRIGGADWSGPLPMLAADGFGYRLRARLAARGGRLGYHRADSHEVVDVERCPLLVPALDQALAAARAARVPLPRELVLAAGDDGVAAAPALPGLPDRELRRRVGAHGYRLAAGAFFQANAQLLEALVAAAVPEGGGALALDLFAGVGLFTLPLAQRFARVVAIEADPAAVELLRANAPANVEVVAADAAVWLARASFAEPPDLALLDPPRAGAAGVLPALAAARARRIAYVACDPATCARDLAPLLAGGWRLQSVTALDLFPQTFHVETVVHLAPGP